MTIGDIVKTYREQNGLSMQDFADRSGLSKGYISMLEKNRHPQNNKEIAPSLETLNKIAKTMRVSINDLLEATDPTQQIDLNDTPTDPHKGVKIPVIGQVAAGIPIDAIEDIIDYEEIPEDMASAGEYFGLRIKGDSMSPRICDGDIVIVKQQPDAESGDVVICTVNGDNATCKRLNKESGGILLSSINPAYKPRFFSNDEIERIPVEIRGKVVEVRIKDI